MVCTGRRRSSHLTNNATDFSGVAVAGLATTGFQAHLPLTTRPEQEPSDPLMMNGDTTRQQQYAAAKRSAGKRYAYHHTNAVDDSPIHLANSGGAMFSVERGDNSNNTNYDRGGRGIGVNGNGRYD